MDPRLLGYAAYLLTALPLTWAVGRTLHKNGRTFLLDAFVGNDALADSVNHLLVVGFYLLNCGWVARSVIDPYTFDGPATVVAFLADRVGTVSITLGVVHFFNLWVLSRWRRRALGAAHPPVMPNAFLPPKTV